MRKVIDIETHLETCQEYEAKIEELEKENLSLREDIDDLEDYIRELKDDMWKYD